MIWKDIKGYEGLYQVSDEGEVRRILKSGRTKPLKKRQSKYFTVNLSKHNQKTTFNVHRLVAETYLDMGEGKTEVNHKDGNKLNNHVENLEWVTALENQTHAIEVLNKNPFGKPPKKVRCYDPETGETVQIFPSIAAAARYIGKMCAKTGIVSVCNGYQDTSYGYKWEFIN